MTTEADLRRNGYPPAPRKQPDEWENNLRFKIAFICMAAVAGKEGDLKTLTNDLVNWLRAK